MLRTDIHSGGGTFRILDLIVYDRELKQHERMTIDSVFTTSGQTMARDVTVNVNGKTAFVCTLLLHSFPSVPLKLLLVPRNTACLRMTYSFPLAVCPIR